MGPTLRFYRLVTLCHIAAACSACGGRSELWNGDADAASAVSAAAAGGAASATTNAGTGAGGSGCVDAVLGTDIDGAGFLALTDEAAFWTTNDDLIMRAPLAGGPAVQVARADATPLGLAIDPSFVYWCEPTRIVRQALDGSAGPEVFADGQANPMAPAIRGGEAWWLNAGAGLFSGEVVYRHADGTTEVIADQIDNAKWMRVDGDNAYFLGEALATSTGTSYGVVARVALHGGPVEPLVIGLHQPSMLTLSSDDIHWIEQLGLSLELSGSVYRVSKSGGSPLLLGQIPNELALGIAVDETDAYVTTYDSAPEGALWRVPQSGEAPVELASLSGAALYADVAVTTDAVVWTAAWSPGTMPAGTPSVRKLCK